MTMTCELSEHNEVNADQSTVPTQYDRTYRVDYTKLV